MTLVYFVVLKDHRASWQLAAGGIGKVLQFGFPVLYVWFILRQPPRLPGRPWAGIRPCLAFGSLIFLLMLALYHLVMEPLGAFEEPGREIRDKIRGMGLDSTGRYLVLGVFYSLIHSLLEEYYWRWFVFRQLRERISLHWAIVISSLGFTAHHVVILVVYFGASSWITYVFVAGVAVGGAVWATLYDRYRTLLGPWLSHALVDLAIFTIGYAVAGDLLS